MVVLTRVSGIGKAEGKEDEYHDEDNKNCTAPYFF
jgi:hypothetical protein